MITNPAIRANVNSLSAKEDLAVILEIKSHDGSSVFRITDFAKGLVSNSETYSFMNFSFTKQMASRDEVPHGSLIIENSGGELIREIEKTGGGRGVELRAALLRPSDPDVTIDDVYFEIVSINVTLETVTFNLVVNNNFERPAVRWKFDKKRYGGLFL